MIIAGLYSFKGGQAVLESAYRSELHEIKRAIASVNATTPDRALYTPRYLSRILRQQFKACGWQKRPVRCEYTTKFYVRGYAPAPLSKDMVREMDLVKNRVGVEIQFGKYASVVYDICAKMTIFYKLGVIDVGVQIVPIQAFSSQMSSRVLCFEQSVWDLEHRGVADIDIPVLVLGITT